MSIVRWFFAQVTNQTDWHAKWALQAPAVLPVAGYSLTYPEGEHSTQLSVTDTSARTVFCRIDDKIRIAGMMDIGRKQSEVPTERLGILKAQAQSRFPEMAEYSKEGKSVDWGSRHVC